MHVCIRSRKTCIILQKLNETKRQTKNRTMNNEQVTMTLLRIEQKLDALASQMKMLDSKIGKGLNMKSRIRTLADSLPPDEVFDAIDEEELRHAESILNTNA